MSGILRPMGRDGTGYDPLAGKDESYIRAWNEAVATIAKAFSAAAEVGPLGVEDAARPHSVFKDIEGLGVLDPARRRDP